MLRIENLTLYKIVVGIKQIMQKIKRLIKYTTRKNQLETIVEQLKKYPFVEKMMVCQQCSTQMMKLTYLDILNTPNAVYPWELETFAELSLFAEAPAPACSFKKSDAEFTDIINIIRNYRHPYLKKQKNMDFANAFIMATALQQFKAQENILDRLYRYEYFWNFKNEEIDMPQMFSNQFDGLTYSEFRNLAVLIFFYASTQGISASIIKALILKYIKVVGFLKITRLDYQKKQSEKLEENYENTIFGFNYLHPYPFIEFEGYLFLPLPYLIVDAVTESLLTRITVDNNLLREKIGKEVAQAYIEEIFKEGNVYDEVLPECTYSVGKNRIDSPDVLLRQANQFCFIDTKLSTPNLEVRKFNNEVIEQTILRYSKNIIQMYNRIREFNDECYYPFKEKVDIDKINVFGIVAVLDDSYVSRRQIYDKVFSQLKMVEDSEEAKYIKANIRITNFRDLECFAFCSHDIFVALTNKRDNVKEWNDMGIFDKLLYKNGKNKVLPSVKRFTDVCRGEILQTTDEFVKLGLIKKS